jgi:hypothetical protein
MMEMTAVPIRNCKAICYFLAIAFYGYGQFGFAMEAPFPRKFSKSYLKLKLKLTQSILRITEAAKKKQEIN